MSQPRPRVVISRCITFENCRWNGLIISSEMVERMKPHFEFLTVCAEKEIGLGVPRKPIRIVKQDDGLHLMQSETEADVTERMVTFASEYCGALAEVDGFILKSRSPSCGMKEVKVYPALGKVQALRDKAHGFFAAEVLRRFPHLPVEDEGRLTNFRIREHFYARLYAIARLRILKSAFSMKELVAFHEHNKLLLMSYNQKVMRELGRIVANHDKLSPGDVRSRYEKGFLEAFAKQPRYTSNLNVLMHALGYFKEGLSKAEKAFFMETLERYKEGTIPLSVPVSIIKSFVIRFGQEYLAQQTYFDPYPEDLMELKDSGEGRKY